MRFVLLAGLALALLAQDPERFHTTRDSRIVLPLPGEEDAFFFVVFGDRTGGPPEGIAVLEQAVAETNLLEPDLVMTVGDLVQGYNETPQWLEQMREFKGVMDRLRCPWFPVAGNHDVYWRGPQGVRPPPGENESNYEANFGPLWYAFRHKTAWFIALYSDEGDPATGLKSHSEPAAQKMSPAQLTWLADALSRARGADHVFVFLHHPRWLKGGYGDDWDNVHALLASAGNVSAVFAGHIHRMRYDGVRDGIEYFTLATVGGAQSGVVPRAGYLHQFNVVTVRKDHIAVASLPVGSVEDPRQITGTVSDETRTLAAVRPVWSAPLPLASDLSVSATLEAQLTNPVSRPIEVTLVPTSPDRRWQLGPDHQHLTIPPGETRKWEITVGRAPGSLDDLFALPELELRMDYLAPTWRVELPVASVALPLDARGLPEPPVPTTESALALDGDADYVSVPSTALALPDGPFTLETWLQATAFGERVGVASLAENCEFGLFASGGVPSFLVHLGGAYVTATADAHRLEPGRWHHVAGVFDGAEVRLYVDGKLAAAVPGAGKRTLADLPFVVGADVTATGGATSYFSGALDELRLSRGARYSGKELEPRRRSTPDADTLLLLHMDGPLGPWVFDSSPRHVHPRRHGEARVVTAP